MFFYLKTNGIDNTQCKLGITKRHPKHRLQEYRTGDVTAEYFKVAKFTGISDRVLIAIEKRCLNVTKMYGKRLVEFPNNECRFADPNVLWKLCESTFTYDYTVFTDINLIQDDNVSTEIEVHELFASYDDMLFYEDSLFPFTLRGYQISAYAELTNVLNNIDTICNLNVLCRCGKTVLFMKYMWDYFDVFQTFVYVAPRLNLIRNMINKFKHVFKGRVDYIEVSSNSDSQINVLRGKQLKNQCKSRKSILFTCNNSFKHLKHLVKNNPSDILFIFDEAHYLNCCKQGNPLQYLVDWEAEHQKRMFVTATPKYGDFVSNDMVMFMNDPYYFGPYSNRVKFNDIKAALEQKFISPCKLIIGAYKSSSIKKDTTSISRAIQLIIDCNADESLIYKPSKILMYANTIESVNNCYSSLTNAEELKDYKIYKLTSSMRSKQQRESLQRFDESEEKCILVNCKMITEGIDIQNIDTVVFVDPKYAKADIVQILMRPRTYKDNKLSYIMIPQNIDVKSGFETIKTVISELILNNDPDVNNIMVIDSDKLHSTSVRTQDSEGEISEPDLNIKKVIMEITEKQLKMIGSDETNRIIQTLDGDSWMCVDEICVVAHVKKNDCKKILKMLLQSHRIKCETYNNIKFYKLSGRFTQRITLDEFIKRLQDLDIKTETDYRNAFAGIYDSIYTHFPEDDYPGFGWDKLNGGTSEHKYYEFNDCRIAVEKILEDPAHLEKIKGMIRIHDKLTYLHSLDSRIPLDLYGVYKLDKFYKFHEHLQHKTIRF